MSGPVFVIDAQGQPLMPLAEAHARRLLRSGNAQLRQHVTLTIIQLKRIVEQPILRPVLVGIAIHPTTAELFLLAEGPRAVFPLLYIVADLRSRPRSHGHTLWRRRRVGRLVRTRVHDIGVAMAAFWQFLPLSHVVIFPTVERCPTYPGEARQLKRYLKSHGLHIAITRRDGPTPQIIPTALYEALLRFVAQPTALTPTLVAQPLPIPRGAARLKQIQILYHTGIIAPGIGTVGNPPLRGIYYEYPLEDADLTLHVPVAAGPAGVVWRRVVVEPTVAFQWSPLVTVGLLPLSIVTVQPGITPCDDDFDG